MIHYYQPELAPGWLLPEPDRFEEKFGGLPWGFPVEKWPICTLCEVSLPLVAQLRHHPKRLDLGKEGRVLFFFLCHDEYCDWSEYHVEILSEEELGHGLVRPQELPVSVLPEVRVTGWREKTELLPPEEAWKCWDASAWDEEWFEMMQRTASGLKLGGLPRWNRAPRDATLPGEWRKGNWRFAAQLEPEIRLPGAWITPELKINRFHEFEYLEVLEIFPEVGDPFHIYYYKDEDTYKLRVMNAWDTGYLFIDPDPVNPRGLFFTQVF